MLSESNNIKARFQELVIQYNDLLPNIEILERTNNIRFQYYFDPEQDFQTNFEFFMNNCHQNSINSQILYCKYVIERELADFLFISETCDEKEIEEMLEILDSKKIFADIASSFEKLDLLTIEVAKNPDFENPTNMLIMPVNLEEILTTLAENRSGRGKNSLAKSISALKTIAFSNFNQQDFVKKIHKVIDDKSSRNMQVTTYGSLVERYSPNRSTTKVLFIRLPIIHENIEKLQTIYGNPALESLCYVTGFGNFNDCGFDEHDFYQMLIEKTRAVEGEIQKIADLVHRPFTNQSEHEIRELLDNSQKKLQELCSDKKKV